jgi:hypothetical protein
MVRATALIVDRAGLQKGDAHFEATFGNFAGQVEASALASSVDAFMSHLEADGALLRLGPSIHPTMHHGAMVSRAELDEPRNHRPDGHTLGGLKAGSALVNPVRAAFGHLKPPS